MPYMLASNRAIYGGEIMKDGGPAFPIRFGSDGMALRDTGDEAAILRTLIARYQ